MSGLAGVFVPAGGAVDREAFARVVAQIAYRGPDGLASWFGPGVAMAFAKFARTPDAPGDRQPIYAAAPATCVTFDGRLDNRDELAAALDLPLSGTTCDSALVSAAYARWGADCVGRLLGDFALAIWDGRERRLLAARDVMGLRPLFYREHGGAWWWASDQRALVELDMPPVNEGYVGEYLCQRVTSVDETLYRGIHRLPMAHTLVLTANGRSRRRYWRPDPDPRPPCRDTREYVAQYRHLLDQAVRARLRLHGRAALFMSGGVDSPSVAVAIAAAARDGHAAAADLPAFSMTLPGRRECEAPVVRQVIARVGLRSVLLPAEDPPEAHFVDDAEASLDLPKPPGSSLALPLVRAVRRGGRHTIFTGHGGDDWFETSYAELGDLLRRGRVVAWARRLAALSQVPNQTATIELARLGLWMALPDAARRAARRALRRTPVPWWIDPAFARAHDLADRLRRRPDPVGFSSWLAADLFAGATGGGAAFSRDMDERYNAGLGLEGRHPLMDRRLIEFGLALPADLRCRGGVSKALMREAMLDELPPAVTRTPANDDFGFLGLRALAHLGGVARVLDARPVRRGWVRADAVTRLYESLEAGATRSLWPLSAVVVTDFWLRALDTRGAARKGSHGEASLDIGA